jgi:hypothetical protein
VSCLLLAALAAALVALNVTVSRGISPFDEATHADYALRVSQGEVPVAGDLLAQEVLREWACRGSASGTLPLPPCDSGALDPATYPAGGRQYNSGHPPLYYTVTGHAARVLSQATGLGFLDAARLTGVAWLTAGLWVLLAALRRTGASWTLATALAAVVGLAPAVVHASSTVNNDAGAVLAGALALAVGLRVLDGAASWPAFGAVAVVVAALKAIFALALVPIGLVLLLQAVRSPADRQRLLRVLAAGAVGATAVVVAWSVLQAERASGDVDSAVRGVNTRDAERLPVTAALRTLLAAWPPVDRPFLETGLDQPAVVAWSALVILLLGSAPLLGVVAARSVVGRDVSLGAGLAMLSVPVAVELHTYLTTGQYFPGIAPRYGLCLVPSLAIALASVVRNRTTEIGLAVLAGVGAAGVVVGLLAG